MTETAQDSPKLGSVTSRLRGSLRCRRGTIRLTPAGASLVCMVERKDPFRPTWTIRSPSGRQLTVEFDRLRSHWRVTPGEYVRRRLVDALAQATGSSPTADWIVKVERGLSSELQAL